MRSFVSSLLVLFSVLAFGGSARVRLFIGQVQYKEPTGGPWKDITMINFELKEGSRIRIPSPEDEVELEMSDGSILRIMGTAMVSLDKINSQGKTSVLADAGRLWAKVTGKKEMGAFAIKGATAVAAVRGTEFGYVSSSSGDKVMVVDGEVEVSDKSGLGKVILRPGYMTSIQPGFAPSKPSTFSVEDLRGEFGDEAVKSAEEKGIFGGKKQEGEKKEEQKAEEKKAQTEEQQTQPEPEEATEESKPAPPPPPPTTSKQETGGAKPTSPAKEEKKETCEAGEGFNWSLSVENIDGKNWNKLLLNPVLRFGKLGVGLYVTIYFDPNEPIYDAKRWYNYDEWDFRGFKDSVHDLFLKIMFLSYGSLGDKVYAIVGNIPNFVIGHGFLMNHYSNMLNFPSERRVGFQLNIDFDRFGFESMMADVYRTKIFGGRFYVRPFYGKTLFGKLAFGLSGIADLHPTVSDRNPSVFATGVDADFPIFDIGVLSLTLYSDFAKEGYYFRDPATSPLGTGHLDEKGKVKFVKGFGIAAGGMGTIIGFIDYKAEYRHLSGNFIPEYFSTTYEAERFSKAYDLLNTTREDFKGWLVEAGFSFKGVGRAFLNFQEYYGNSDGKPTCENRLHIEAYIDKCLVKKFYGGFSYDRTHLVGLDFLKKPFGENTIVTTEVYYQVGEGVYIGTIYRRFYNTDGTYEENVSVETKMEI